MTVGVWDPALDGDAAPQRCFRETIAALADRGVEIVRPDGYTSPRRFARAEHLDVLHYNTAMDASRPVQVDARTVLTYHGDVQWAQPRLNYGRWPLLRSAKERLVDVYKLWQYDAVCFASRSHRDRMVRRGLVAPSNAHVTPNAPLSHVAPDHGTDWLAEYGVERPYVLHVSARSPRKNPAGVYAGFAAAKMADHELVLAGEGWGDLGRVPDAALGQLYTHADALLFPSYHECFGLPAVEALACGTPPVVADRYALPEVVGRHGYLADPDDHRAIALALRAAVAAEIDPVCRYDWDETADRLINLYHELQ